MPKFIDVCPKESLMNMYKIMDQATIAKRIGFSTRSICRYLKKWNIEKRVSGRTTPWHVLDEDTEVINYFGGFLYADGCLQKTSKSGYTCRLSLSIKDAYILRMFHEEIVGSKYSEYIDAVGKKMGSLHLHGVDLKEKLERFGIVQDKRYHWTPPIITDTMLPHFLRGWFDGDGYIGKNKYTMVLTNINKEAIEYFDANINLLGYTPYKYKFNYKTKSFYHNPIKAYTNKNGRTIYRYIITGQMNCQQIYSLLKGNSPIRLHRKWKLFDS
jgi:hypothetical protein